MGNHFVLLVNPLWMAIFNSYVSLPEGKRHPTQLLGDIISDRASRSGCPEVLKELHPSLPMLAVPPKVPRIQHWWNHLPGALQGADGGVVRHFYRIQVDDLEGPHFGQIPNKKSHPISPSRKYHRDEVIKRYKKIQKKTWCLKNLKLPLEANLMGKYDGNMYIVHGNTMEIPWDCPCLKDFPRLGWPATDWRAQGPSPRSHYGPRRH